MVGLDQLATAPVSGRGMRLGFNATTGAPEFAPETAGAGLGTATPQPAGGTPDPGTSAAGLPEDHVHGIASDSVGLAELAPAPSPADYGRYIGFDPTTGDPTVLSAGGGTFLSQTDTPSAFGVVSQVPQVNAARDGLEFGGPYQPLEAPGLPTNLRATDAFDMALEFAFSAGTGADHYEWQRKLSSVAWPAGDGTVTTTLSIRNTAPLPLGTYDVRVRSVGIGGLLKSNWVELLNIPVIVTPTPIASPNNILTRNGSQTLRFSWDNLDVNNGGSGAARVIKEAIYDYQYREAGTLTWGSLVAHNTSLIVDVRNLINGTTYEMRVMATVERSDMTRTDVPGPWSNASNQERPVKDTVTLTYGVAPTRTGAISSPRTVEIPVNGGITFEITNALNPVADGEFYALDFARGDEYARDYNISVLETRPLATDITAGSSYMAEANPSTGPRRYSVGPAAANSAVQTWYVEVA